jgi:hypothetical protein
VIRYSFGTLEARFKGEPLNIQNSSVIPKEYHPIKDVSHSVFLAALLFDEQRGAARDKDVAASLDAVARALTQLADERSEIVAMIPPDQLDRQRRLLSAVQSALTAFSVGQLNAEAQNAFFVAVRPDLLTNLRVVAGAVVRSLDASVRQFRKMAEEKDPRAWDSVVVIVGVAHQARAREIGIQYFERLLKEPVGEGARSERRLVIAEGMSRGPEQYGALSAHLVDQAGGEKVFGDASRLQWDVLADDGGELNRVLPVTPRAP